MSNEPIATTDHFDSETLLSLRESARTYQKLDLTYLAAAGTLVTALKINNDTLIELGAGFFFGAIAYVLLLALDTHTEQLIFKDWIQSKKNSNNRLNTSTIQRWLKRQPIFHFLFLSCVLMFFFGMARGITDFRGEMSARASIQTYTSLFFYKNDRPPKSIEELIAAYPRAGVAHGKIDQEPVSFSSDEDGGYILIFAGNDKKIGTSDDTEVTESVSLSSILESTKK